MINDKIIVALDTAEREHLDFLRSELKGNASYVKVGMELFYTFGIDIIKLLKDDGFKIFLDLKMHDIPQTVHNACKTLAKNGVDLINLHIAGGSEMMQAGYEGFKSEAPHGKIIGVTQLTSTNQITLNRDILIPGDLTETIVKYAKLAQKSSLDGVVCSALEIELIKKEVGPGFQCITPGIRPNGSAVNDQKRVMTPLEAIKAGTDHMVIGRPITKAQSPKQAFLDILKEIS
jgi:orotidine-5'-phosphate decarboxylase